MTQAEQTIAFSNDLDKLVDRYGSEFELTYAAIIGALYMKIHVLCDHAQGSEPPETDEAWKG